MNKTHAVIAYTQGYVEQYYLMNESTFLDISNIHKHKIKYLRVVPKSEPADECPHCRAKLRKLETEADIAYYNSEEEDSTSPYECGRVVLSEWGTAEIVKCPSSLSELVKSNLEDDEIVMEGSPSSRFKRIGIVSDFFEDDDRNIEHSWSGFRDNLYLIDERDTVIGKVIHLSNGYRFGTVLTYIDDCGSVNVSGGYKEFKKWYDELVESKYYIAELNSDYLAILEILKEFYDDRRALATEILALRKKFL